jgi:arylsulfatase
MRCGLKWPLGWVVIAAAALVCNAAVATAPPRPNVVVILADDLGFSDLGCYGGEIDTPHLDTLAAGGLRFTQGYNTARCWPSRAALLTGYYAQAVGRDALPGGKGGNDTARPPWARLLPQRLASAGYRSYHSGKWHVDGDPREQGFARSLLVDAAAQSNYFTTLSVTADGRPVPETDASYVTTIIGDHAVDCLRGHAAQHAGTPFFHYVAFTAPHFPLHAPADLVAKYRDRYGAGWDAVRAARVARVAELGIVTTPAGDMERGVGPPYPMKDMRERLGTAEVNQPVAWADLTAEQRSFQAEKMAIHAAMVEALDREVGRIVAELKAAGLFDDTLILFASDNGASAEMLVRGEGHDSAAPPGSRKSFLCLGPGWSSCANAPFRRHKMWVHEGGIATPWIVHWPRGVAARGELRRSMVHLVDVTPTVMELAGVAAPVEHDGRPVPPMHGRSFLKAVGDPQAPVHDTLWWCHGGHRAVRVGDWKLVADRQKGWELYDLAADRCETKDLAATEPARVRDLESRWQAIAAECARLAASGPAVEAPRPATPAAPGKRPPNVVLVFCDDLGYGDPSCYGGKVPTPHIDRIAREGIRFTDFHVPHPVCSASRAALLTGCYGPRVSIHGALMPDSTHGLAAAETTLAELLRDRGYRTACVGKWHLGHLPEFLPTRHGFEEWLGLPYSNDMWPPNGGRYPPLPLFDGERVIDEDVSAADQATLTGRYAARAVDFIERAAGAGDGRPFFLYLAHTMPHIPLFVGEEFRGMSAAGIYGDVVTEIDASVGAVLDALDRTGRVQDTLVIFTSDNGPWLRFGNHGGSAGPLREGKGTVFEGGIREPCVARLPGVIPAGSTSDALLATIDILPTVAALTGDPLPLDEAGSCIVAGKRIDGHDRQAAFTATEPASVSDGVTHWYHYRTGELQAVRRGRWKLFLPHNADSIAGQEPGRDGRIGKTAPLPVGRELYDLQADPGERHDVAAAHPEIVADLERVAEAARAELGDALTSRQGAGVRPPGGVVKPPKPKPVATARPPTAQRRRPNVIYVMTDDQGYGDIAAHGNPVIRTPHLDRLRRESVRFTEFHASPTCAPTRAALLTGRHEFRSGVTHTILERERLALSATTLPELLRTAGYTTGIFGKWHLGDEDEYQPGRRGFDRVFIHGAGGIGQSYPGSCGDVPGNSYFDPWIRSDGTFVKTSGYCTDVFFTAALEWIDSCRTQGKPFFCYLTPNAPHDPLDCPVGSDAPYLAPLEAAGITDEKQRGKIARFYGMIENIDANVGRLLAKLDAWGLADDTLVVFTTDNGTATGAPVFNAGMRGRKPQPYRGGTRVPAFWRWQGTLPAGVDVPALVAHVDVLPTLCEITATAIPAAVAARVEGRSLVPLLHEATAVWPDRPLVTHVGRWDRGKAAESALRNCRIREGRWSLVNVRNDPAAWELYDLAADPGEARDVAADHPGEVARLAGMYAEWWNSVQGDLVNEDRDGPAEHPFKTAFLAEQAATGGRDE